MNKFQSGLLGACIAIVAVVVTITVCIVCFRIVNPPVSPADNDNNIAGHGQTDGANHQIPDQLPGPNAGLGKNKIAVPTLGGNERNTKFIVAVDSDDLRRARELEEMKRQELFDKVDDVTGGGDNGINSNSPDDFFKFHDLPPNQKNRLWWEIAALSEVDIDNSVKYTLTMVKARLIASKYQTSALEVFRLFREGSTASWRSNYPPNENEDN